MTRSLIAGAFALVAAASAHAQQPVAGTIAIKNVNVLPMDAPRVLRDQTVIVENGRITRIGAAASVAAPANATVVDGRGKFLMPGLIDTHIHLVAGTGAPGDNVAQELALLVANGVTTARSLGGNAQNAVAIRDKVKSGELLGPRLLVAGASLNKNSTPTAQAVREAIEKQSAAGFDFLKTHGVSSEVYDTMVATAKRLNMRLVGHVIPDYGLNRAIAAHQQVEHMDGYMAALSKDANFPGGQFFFGPELDAIQPSAMPALAQRLKQEGIWTSPTLALFETAATTKGADAFLQWPELQYASAQAKQAYTNQVNGNSQNPPPADRAAKYIELRRAMVRALRDAKAPIMTGSDSPQFFFMPGFALHREMEGLAAAGLTNFEVLSAATTSAVAYFNHVGIQADYGTVAVGKVADLILVDANPLDDVNNTRRLSGVMLAGKWLDSAALKGLLDQVSTWVKG
jgi:imidazolonepropionase-like amidohydrolase